MAPLTLIRHSRKTRYDTSSVRTTLLCCAFGVLNWSCLFWCVLDGFTFTASVWVPHLTVPHDEGYLRALLFRLINRPHKLLKSLKSLAHFHSSEEAQNPCIYVVKLKPYDGALKALK